MSEAAQDLGEAILNNIRAPAPEVEAPAPKRGASSGRLIDPPKEDEVLVTYPDTLDGFVAAWVVRKVAQKHNIALEMHCQTMGNMHGGAGLGRNHIHIGPDAPKDTEGKSLLTIDTAGGAVPPLAFKSWKRTFPFGIETMTAGKFGHISGTSLAAACYDFFHADRKGFDPRPRFLDYLNDSLGQNRFGDTDAVMACAESYRRNFRVYDAFIEACDDRKRLAYVIAGGQAILRYKEIQNDDKSD